MMSVKTVRYNYLTLLKLSRQDTYTTEGKLLLILKKRQL